MRWVGIDEAGYGPNLGPLVMTAVVAEGPDDRDARRLGRPRLDRRPRRGAAGPALGGRLEEGLQGRPGARPARRRLPGRARRRPAGPSRGRSAGCSRRSGAGTLDEVELSPWLDGRDPRYPDLRSRAMAERTLARRPLDGAPWRVVDVRSVVVGPRRVQRRARRDRLEGAGPLRRLRPAPGPPPGDDPDGPGRRDPVGQARRPALLRRPPGRGLPRRPGRAGAPRGPT